MPESETLEEQFLSELVSLETSGAGLPFVFSPSEAWYLLALLQLVLRHPRIHEHDAPAKFARYLAEQIEQRMCSRGQAMTEMARRGWLPEHDV